MKKIINIFLTLIIVTGIYVPAVNAEENLKCDFSANFDTDECLSDSSQNVIPAAQSDVDAAVAEIGDEYNSIFSAEAEKTYSVTGILVEDKDGMRCNYFKGGTLISVYLNKYTAEPFDGKLYAAIYAGNGNIEAVSAGDAVFDETEGNKSVSLSLALGEDIRDKKVCFYLWNNEMSPKIQKFLWTPENNWSVTYNGKTVRLDSMPVIDSDGELYINAKNVINLMGIPLEKYGNSYIAQSNDGKYIEFSIGAKAVNINGSERTMAKEAYLCDDAAVMLPFSVIEESFGCTVGIGEISGEIMVLGNQSEVKYPEPSEDNIDISYTSGMHYGSYEVTYSDPDAVIEVWYKDNLYNTGEVRSLYWQKCANAVYDENTGHYCGGFSNLAKSRYYNVKYRITSGGASKTYVDKKAFITMGYTEPEYADTLYSSDGGIKLVPTFENLSYYIDYTGDAESCQVLYRQFGTGKWYNALSPYNDTTAKQFRGTITNLQEGAGYYVKAVIKYSDGTSEERTTQPNNGVRMWTGSPVIGKTVNLSDIYTSGQLMLSNLKGTKNSWIKIDGNGVTVDAGKNYIEAVIINNCEYVILEGVTVKGGYRHGISVNGNCSNVRIVNCDISEWGRTGVYTENGAYRICDGTEINYDAGILLLEAKNTVVERCYIHDSDATTNAWNGDTWSSLHPKGVSGIFYRVREGCVIRYNDIVGSDTHRWNDGIEGDGNGQRQGGSAVNTDIYGNTIAFAQDDGIELDGGQMNARVYKNRIEQCLCGVSCVPNMTGPSYIFKNLICNLGCSYKNQEGRGIKIGGNADGIIGKTYIINNTIDINSASVENIKYGQSGVFHADTYNNIFINRKGNSAFKNTEDDGINVYKNDLISGVRTGYTNYSGSIFNTLPEYVNIEKGDYRVESGAAFESGTAVDNFTEADSVNIGAFQSGDRYLPCRPADMYADAYYTKINDGGQISITVYLGAIGENRSYSICKAKDMEWLSISSAQSGTADADSEVSVTLNADMSACGTEYGKGMILFRLDNGYSIPITVECEKE